MNRFKWPKRLAAGALLALILSLSLAVPALAQPVVPLLFNGDVTIGGADAPIGTTISAEIDSAEVASTSTTMAGRYAISIDFDSGYIGKTVVLKVNGTYGGEGTYVDPMETPIVTVNLAVTGVTTYTLTMAVSGNGTTDPPVGGHSYDAGTVVDITATALAGWQFDSWTGDVADSSSATTTIAMDSDKTVTANFSETPVTYTLTMAVNGSGSTSPAVGTHSYDAGTVVPIIATPGSGYHFVNWTGDVASPNSATTTVTMDSNKTVTANFSETPVTHYTLTMAVNGSGSTSPAVGTHNYAAGTVVSIIATPGSGWQFVSWTGAVASPYSATTTVTMDSSKTITANFSEIPVTYYYTLTMAVSGNGTTDPPVGEHSCDAGTVVGLVASPAAGYQFVNWTGDVDTVADTSAASTTILMDGDYFIQANFEAIPPVQYELTISSTTGGSVTTPGEGIFTYNEGSVVSLVAIPVFGYGFDKWTGDVSTVANVNDPTATITMNGDYTIRANFKVLIPEQYELTISSTSGGSVTTPGEGTFTYNEGDVVSLVATPNPGNQFVNWTGNVGTVANVNDPTTTITINADNSITANFEAEAEPAEEEEPNWPLIGGIIAGGIILLFFLMRRRAA